VRELQRHRLAAGAREFVLRGGAHDLAAVAVGDDEARVLGQHLAGKRRRHGEEQPVAELAILGPLLVGAEVFQRGLDLDDPNLAAVGDAGHVRPPPVGQSHLAHRRQPVGLEQPGNAPADGERRR
jgi:hypothetical protein